MNGTIGAKLRSGILCFILLICATGTTSAQWNWWNFYDISYQFSPSENASRSLKNGAFVLGQYDLFTSYNIDNRIEVLAELVFEAPGGELEVDLERLLISYTFIDLLTLEVGRGHSPLGYYGNTFHHGRQLESTINRPLILEFEDEGGLVPAHNVGMWLRGFTAGNAGVMDYTIGVANGQQIDADHGELALNLNEDDNPNKILFGKLNLEPAILCGLGIGGSFYRGKVNGFSELSESPVIDLDQNIFGAHLFYDILPVQILAEYYNVNSKDMLDTAKPSYNSTGYFAQAAYEFKEKIRPYARIEELAPEMGDPYGNTLIGTEDVQRITGGVRFNISTQSSIKLEAITQKFGDNDSYLIIGTQWAVVF